MKRYCQKCGAVETNETNCCPNGCGGTLPWSVHTEKRYCPICETNVDADENGKCPSPACGGTYPARSVPVTKYPKYRIQWHYPEAATSETKTWERNAQNADDALVMWRAECFGRGWHPSNQPRVSRIEIVE